MSPLKRNPWGRGASIDDVVTVLLEGLSVELSPSQCVDVVRTFATLHAGVTCPVVNVPQFLKQCGVGGNDAIIKEAGGGDDDDHDDRHLRDIILPEDGGNDVTHGEGVPILSPDTVQLPGNDGTDDDSGVVRNLGLDPSDEPFGGQEGGEDRSDAQGTGGGTWKYRDDDDDDVIISRTWRPHYVSNTERIDNDSIITGCWCWWWSRAAQQPGRGPPRYDWILPLHGERCGRGPPAAAAAAGGKQRGGGD